MHRFQLKNRNPYRLLGLSSRASTKELAERLTLLARQGHQQEAARLWKILRDPDERHLHAALQNGLALYGRAEFTPFEPGDEVEPPGFWERVGAFLRSIFSPPRHGAPGPWN